MNPLVKSGLNHPELIFHRDTPLIISFISLAKAIAKF